MIDMTSGANNRAVMLRMQRMTSASKRGMYKGWIESGQSLRRDAAKEILRHPKSGRIYTVRKGRAGRGPLVRHRASSPGETHANITGRTRRSLSWKTSGFDEMAFGYGVASNKQGNPPDYAKDLEFGTSRMAARPSLQNAIKSNTRNIQTYHGISIKREIEKIR